MRKVFLTAFLFLITSMTLAGQDIYEAGVRANGMLGAYTALANDASSIFYNPAGLAKANGIEVIGGATFISPRTTFRNTTTELGPYGLEQEMDKQTFTIPNFYGSYQIQEGLTAGLGVYVPFGLGTRWDDDWIGRASSIEANIETVFINPAIGYTLPDFGIGDIHIGAGLTILASGSVQQRRAITTFVPEGEFNLEGTLDSPGYGYNIGLKYEPVDLITFGFTYRSGVKAEFSGDAEFTNTPDELFTNTGGSTSIDLPASFVGAIAVHPSEQLTVEFDYVWWGWSSFDALVINFDEAMLGLDPQLEQPQDQTTNIRDYKDVYQLRLGSEYRDAFVDGLTLRAGFTYDKTPIREVRVDPTLPEADRIQWALGVSYTVLPELTIDAGYIHIRANERTIEDPEADLRGVYNTLAYLPSIGFTLKL